MSQFGCATSPFHESVETTYTGSSPSGTGTGTGTASPWTSVQGIPSQTSPATTTPTAGTTAPASTGLSLSTGEIVGIAIGALVLLLFVSYLLKRCSTTRHSTPLQPPPSNYTPNFGPPPEIYLMGPPSSRPPYMHPQSPHSVFSETLSGHISPDDSVSNVGSHWRPTSLEIRRYQTPPTSPPPSELRTYAPTTLLTARP
jgi:hypothetical protein